MRRKSDIKFKGVDQTPLQFTAQGVFSLFVFVVLLGFGVFGAKFIGFSFWMVGALVIFVPLFVYLNIASGYVVSVESAISTLGATVKTVSTRGAKAVEWISNYQDHFKKNSLKPNKLNIFRSKFKPISNFAKKVLSGFSDSKQKTLGEGNTEFINNDAENNINEFRQREERFQEEPQKVSVKSSQKSGWRTKTQRHYQQEDENFQHQPESWKQD
jgi:hypothetical protein